MKKNSSNLTPMPKQGWDKVTYRDAQRIKYNELHGTNYSWGEFSSLLSRRIIKKEALPII